VRVAASYGERVDPTAVVPVRATARAKLRLAHALSADARLELVRRLFAHATSVLHHVGLRIVVVAAGDPPLADVPVDVVADPGRGLNAAVAAGLALTGYPALVVPADLPWLEPRSVERILSEPGDVVIARSRDGGTNALLLRRPLAPAFGADSALAHATTARADGSWARVVEIRGFSDDLDDEPALRAALGRSPGLPSTS
jgi:2-phospho-L-lactate/phosphoenolpyruvate guanylyltransferase